MDQTAPRSRRAANLPSIATAVWPWAKLVGIRGPARFRCVAKRRRDVRTRKLARAPPRFPPCLFLSFHDRAFPPARLLLLGVQRACPVGILGRGWNFDAQGFGTLALGLRGGFRPGGVLRTLGFAVEPRLNPRCCFFCRGLPRRGDAGHRLHGIEQQRRCAACNADHGDKIGQQATEEQVMISPRVRVENAVSGAVHRDRVRDVVGPCPGGRGKGHEASHSRPIRRRGPIRRAVRQTSEPNVLFHGPRYNVG